MIDLLEYISTWSILKWIVLVLIAGFIGQFGRMAAEVIAEKIRAGRGKKEIAPQGPIKPQGQQQSSPAILANTPGQQSSPDTPANTPGQQSSPDEITDKKILKSMAKTRKKNAKKQINLIIGGFRKRF
jgi:hypothetical protein